MNRKDFKELAIARIGEARALLGGGFFDGAYYLGGLSVECALKACIARATQRYDFPDRRRTDRVHTHALDTLLKEAGLEDELQVADSTTRTAWARTKVWRIDARYELGLSKIDVVEFIDAVGGRQGVLPWIKRYW